MLYLYVPLDGDAPWQSYDPPTVDQAEQSIDDQLQVYRLDRNTRQYQLYTPIDRNDPDSWADIPKQKKEVDHGDS